MARRWNTKEEEQKRKELVGLYIKENKTIGEIAGILNLAESTVYDRLIRLNIFPARHKKARYNNIRTDIIIPKYRSSLLAEFVGILLGDGNITRTQVAVTLGSKDEYAGYVAELMNKLFGVNAKIMVLPKGHKVVYIGSTVLVRWFLSMGLSFNKVRSQTDVPGWIFEKNCYKKSALRGLFDTDGSVYKLKFGTQIAFTNYSKPLIISVRKMLLDLGFHPSKISGRNIYITKRSDLDKFFKEIGFKNRKHEKRFFRFFKS